MATSHWLCSSKPHFCNIIPHNSSIDILRHLLNHTARFENKNREHGEHDQHGEHGEYEGYVTARFENKNREHGEHDQHGGYAAPLKRKIKPLRRLIIPLRYD